MGGPEGPNPLADVVLIVVVPKREMSRPAPTIGHGQRYRRAESGRPPDLGLADPPCLRSKVRFGYSRQKGRVRQAESFTRRGLGPRCSRERDVKTRPYDWPCVETSQTQIGSTNESGPCRPVLFPVSDGIWFMRHKEGGSDGRNPLPDVVLVLDVLGQEMSRPAPTKV
jgi:hypothetical protein